MSASTVRDHPPADHADLRRGMDHERAGQVVLETAAPTVPQHHEEPGEQRDRGQDETSDANERSPRLQPGRAVGVDHPDAHDPRSDRLTGGRPEGDEVPDDEHEVRDGEDGRDRGLHAPGQMEDRERERGGRTHHERHEVDDRPIQDVGDRARDQAGVRPVAFGVARGGTACGGAGARPQRCRRLRAGGPRRVVGSPLLRVARRAVDGWRIGGRQRADHERRRLLGRPGRLAFLAGLVLSGHHGAASPAGPTGSGSRRGWRTRRATRSSQTSALPERLRTSSPT